jgi:hypothetical protein
MSYFFEHQLIAEPHHGQHELLSHSTSGLERADFEIETLHDSKANFPSAQAAPFAQ